MTPGLQAIDVGARPLDDHAEVVGAEEVERLRALAEPLAGMRVLHLSAAGQAGRVPELLGSLLPLLAGLGVEVDWRVLFGEGGFRDSTQGLHDGLQGAEAVIDDPVWTEYLADCAAAAGALDGFWDAAVLHDPGPLGVAETEIAGALVWRCHVDASEPDPVAWERARALVERHALAVFALERFAPPEVGVPTRAIAPAIDPLSPKNQELPVRLAGGALRALGVDLTRPFCCQVGRFDRWKDPHGTIDAFAAAKEELPELQLVLAGSLGGESPDDWRVVKEITDYVAGREDVLVLTSYSGLGHLELNALQRVSRLAVQRALREGFGLTASEALWKGTPVVATPSGGVPEQVRDGRDGYLAEDERETAARIVELVRDPALAIELGRSGREHVRERFLVTRLLEDELRLMAAVVSNDAATVEP